MPSRAVFASAGHFQAEGFQPAANAELKVAFPLSMLLFCGSAVG
jgi:hypothetical protein